MKTYLIAVLLACNATLAAQDMRSIFSHQGVNCTQALGHDAAGNLYTAAGGTGPYGNNQAFYPGPAGTTPETLTEWGFIVTKHAPDNTLLWWKGFSMDPTSMAPGNLELLVYDMTVAPSGDVFIVGTFAGTVDFDPGAGLVPATATTTFPAPSHNGYLVKLDTDGNFQWVRHWQGRTEALTVDVASSGNIHVTGVSWGGEIDLDPGTGADLVNDLAGNNAFIAAWISTLDATGNYLWGHFMTVDNTVTQQASSLEMAVFWGATVDSAGNFTVGGSFGGSFAPPGSNPLQYDTNQLVILTEGTPYPRFYGVGNNNMMVISYDPSGNRRWLNHYGSDMQYSMAGNTGWDVTTDDDNAVYFTGGFEGRVNFNPPSGALVDSNYNAGYVGSVFLLKLDTQGAFQWVHAFNGVGAVSNPYNLGKRVLADDSGVLLGGIFTADIDFDPGTGSAVLPVTEGCTFLAKYNKQGQHQWSSNFGSVGTGGAFSYPASDVWAISLTGTHRVAVGGHFNNDFHEPGPGTQVLLTPYSGQATSWIMVLDQTSLHATLQISAANLPALELGLPAVADFTATGGSMIGLSWSIHQGALPPGISLTGTQGTQIQASGAAMSPGIATFELRVEDDMGNVAYRTFQWQVSHPAPEGGGSGGDNGSGGCAAVQGSVGAPLLLLGILAWRRRRVRACGAGA